MNKGLAGHSYSSISARENEEMNDAGLHKHLKEPKIISRLEREKIDRLIKVTAFNFFSNIQEQTNEIAFRRPYKPKEKLLLITVICNSRSVYGTIQQDHLDRSPEMAGGRS